MKQENLACIITWITRNKQDELKSMIVNYLVNIQMKINSISTTPTSLPEDKESIKQNNTERT